MEKRIIQLMKILVVAACGILLSSCSSNKLPQATLHPSKTESIDSYRYLIGAGDSVNIFVYGNPEVSGTFTVRPDGMITTSLVEDIPVSGRTPTELAREIEAVLATFLREPIVTVTVGGFVGPFSEQIRVIGEAAQPLAINYKKNMTLLDVMISVGGLTEFADGNDAVLVRIENGQQKQYSLAIDDLLKQGDISANVDMLPGDIIIVPETWF
ncbi:sugar ABC transporter substrate-binding protein [Thalassotalea euphylliae]|uniref:Sugar ABC transporter substrate-binding protein n=1 Tax=Thalassotalea euphylliae TaxID=1655234 RepID=A0A3E0TKW9_9GAMM|nr:XrtA/PEP-CTERM system exopolysaccharide export protein [Thalassotalea euphylliae]REL25194.1 sugar ABC transporter substrate-binding protein [Thalassotalea euphylliae]